MPYIEVPIIGSGAPRSQKEPHGDPYRPAIALPKRAVIPSNPDGSPKFTTCLVWIPDQYETSIDRTIVRIPIKRARALIRELDPRLNPKAHRADV